jgi:hypothetical protein
VGEVMQQQQGTSLHPSAAAALQAPAPWAAVAAGGAAHSRAGDLQGVVAVLHRSQTTPGACSRRLAAAAQEACLTAGPPWPTKQ